MDFKDLNKAYLKNPHPMPWTDLLVDAIAGHQVHFKVMPFGLKIARVTYQMRWSTEFSRKNYWNNRRIHR